MKKTTKHRAMKAQMFTLTSLIFILLMVTTLLIFVIMGIGYDNLTETVTLSSSSTNYGFILTKSASSFASASASSALTTLFMYEYNSSLRGNNLITNMSQFMTYLMTNAMLPNVPLGSHASNTLTNLMGQSTFASYNSEVSVITGISSKQITVTETKPQVSQQNPYSITVKYTENAQINTTAGLYNFAIPVNVSIPLSNLPDLFYAQQGIYQPMSFTNTQGLVSVVDNYYADFGNTQGFTYGTIYSLPTPPTCANIGPGGTIPSPLNTVPYSTQIIIATPNAVALSGCASLANYGGLVTNKIGSALPTIPFLVFPISANILYNLNTGDQLLLYGPGLSLLQIRHLISAASSDSYFSSPFTASYLDRVTGDFQRASPNGIFTLFGAARQAAVFNSTYYSYLESPPLSTSARTLSVSAWIYPTSTGGDRGIVGQSDGGCADWNLKVFGSQYDFVNYCNNDNTFGSVSLNNWALLTVTFNGGTVTTYLNGQPAGTYTDAGSGSLNTNLPIFIGADPGDVGAVNFNGMISNVQLYSTVLTPSQVNYIYQQGLEGLAVANVPILAWWTLNGNLNDISGNGHNIIVSQSSAFSLLQNYTNDNAYVQPTTSNTYPVPGLLNCRSRGLCFASNSINVFLGDMPLSIGNAGLSSAYFNGKGSNVIITGKVPVSNTITVSAWVNMASGLNALPPSAPQREEVIGSGNFILAVNALGNNEEDLYLYTGISWLGPIASTYGLNPNQWTMLSATFANTGPGTSLVTLYINGVGAGTKAEAIGSVSQNIKNTVLGSWEAPPYTQFYFNGSISNIQVYNTSFSAAQISQLYLSGINGQPLDTKHLVGWWPLDGNTNDYSSYGDTGSAVGVGYTFIQSNYSQSYYAYNSIGLSTSGAVSDEWQTLGFPAHP